MLDNATKVNITRHNGFIVMLSYSSVGAVGASVAGASAATGAGAASTAAVSSPAG